MNKRENFGSRLGFLLVSAGCAIGIGNVWRFPFIAGEYGGAIFVMFYLFFLLILGWPVITMELAVGRGSGMSTGRCFEKLKPGSKWQYFRHFSIAGNYLLMMYYTTVTGWMLNYTWKMISGTFSGMQPGTASHFFDDMLASPLQLMVGMFVAIIIGFGVCARGLQNGVEKVTKPMMVTLFLLMAILAVHSVMLPGGSEGLRFYLLPDIARTAKAGLPAVIYAAMGQAFFTLSVGMGSITIFGSYIGKDRKITAEGGTIIILDTAVALMSGLIIFPCCSAFNIEVDQGPGLVFVTLPEVFARMGGGRIWGTFFFIFMSFASLSTVIAVFENIIAITMDAYNWNRKKAVRLNAILLTLLSIPCPLGYNLLSFIQPLGKGSTILDLEDFLVSNNLLPIGSFLYVIFCCTHYGWGADNFLKEVNTGSGRTFFTSKAVPYMKYVLPTIILFILIGGYVLK